MARYAEAKHYEKRRRCYLKALYRVQSAGTPIVYIDETGFAPSTQRDYGWALTGKRIYGDISGSRRPRTGLIGGYLNNQLIAPVLFNGTCNAEWFNHWLEHYLLPDIPKGSVIVLDNATFHKSSTSLEIARNAGCRLLFLPPYSPHLNPIEKLWANIKRLWRYSSTDSLDNIISSIQ